MRGNKIRRISDSAGKVSLGGAIVFGAKRKNAQPGERTAMMRRNSEHAIIILLRLVELICLASDLSQFVVGTALTGLQCNRTLEFGLGFVVAQNRVQETAQAVVGGRIVGLRLQIGAQIAFGIRKLLFIELHVGESVDDLRIVGREFQSSNES